MNLLEKIRSWLSRRKLDAEMSEEMRLHWERRTEENIASGMSAEEARYAALRKFGGVEQVKERARDGRGRVWLEQTVQDARYAIRQLARAKGFAAVVVLTLSLGIGATTAIFSVIRAVLWQALPYAEAERLVWVSANLGRFQAKDAALSSADFLDYRERSQSFTQLAAAISDGVAMNLSGAGEPERLQGAQVTANYLEVFGVRPALGRTFLREEEEPGRGQVAVLSNNLWVRRFGADPEILGRSILLGGAAITVVGVMPPGFQFPSHIEIWRPFGFAGALLTNRDRHILRVVGRLKPGVTVEQAGAELGRIGRELATLYPRTNQDWSVQVTPLRERMVGNIRLTLLVLFAAVVGVLGIACANVANLLLARGASRQREIAVRAALGAGRNRIVRQLLTESLILALLGGMGGVLLARWGVGLLAATSGAWLPRAGEVVVDGPILGFALVVASGTGLLFGLIPALQALRIDLNEALGDGGHGGGARRHRVLRTLVVGEIALAAVLLIGAGLVVRSFFRLENVDRGFDEKNVLTLRIDLTNPAAPRAKRTAFFEQLRQRVASLPGVESVGMISELPLSTQETGVLFKIENRAGAEAEGAADLRSVDDGYFHTMRIPLLRGRGFTTDEARRGAPSVVISEVLARRFFPAGDALGERLRVEVLNNAVFEVIGIVGDVRHRSLAGNVQPTIYQPTLQAGGTNLVVRTLGSPVSLAGAVRREVLALDANQPVANVKTMEQWALVSLTQPRLRAWLLGMFSAVALLIALVGIYGVMAYAVAQRTHEFGIRMALGATTRDVVRLVIRQGVRLVLAGLGLGLVGALALTRLLQKLLYGTSTTDPVTFLATMALLGGFALLACWLPARRATKVDPMVALRAE